MNSDMQKELREYAWKYFSIHAEQRLKTFHFFIILSTVVVGGLLTVAQRSGLIVYASVLAYLLSFLAFIFWKLDVRNKELIKHGEAALVSLENMMKIQCGDDMSPEVMLFVHERCKTKKKKRFPAMSLLPAHMSYSDCFNAVFMVVGAGSYILGSFFVLIALLR